MKNDFVMQKKDDNLGGFVICEIVKPIFDSKHRDKPLEERWREYQIKKSWFAPWVW